MVSVKITENDAWIDELGETPSVTYRRYVQSGHEEVSDPDEWADIHFAANSSRARSRSRSNEEMATPISKRMPLSFLLSAIVDLQKSVQRQWLLMQKDRECRGVRQVIRASGSRPSRAVPSGDSVNYYQDSVGVASFSTLDWFLVNYLHLKTTGGTSLDKDKDQKQSWFTIQEAFQTLWRVAWTQ